MAPNTEHPQGRCAIAFAICSTGVPLVKSLVVSTSLASFTAATDALPVSRSNEMGVRKKGRVKFTFNDRQFVWWIDNDTFLRIASDDKRFVVANLLIDRLDLLAVHGPDFPGITSSVLRPVWLVMPDFDCGANFGRRVALILNWCLNGSSHPQFAGQLPQYAGGG